jgi:hypothetical protein
MGNIESIYTREVYANLRPLHANWEPSHPAALGDFGLLDGRRFVHQGNIQQFGIQFKILENPAKTQKIFSSSGTAEYSLVPGVKSAVGVIETSAKVEIGFSSADSVFLMLRSACTQS